MTTTQIVFFVTDVRNKAITMDAPSNNASHMLQSESKHLPESMAEQLEKIRPEINILIAKHRLLRMIEGAKFHKYSGKGQKQKDKYWTCKLSPDHRYLHYADLEDKRELSLEEFPNRIPVSDFKRLLTRRECPFMKDQHSKRSIVDLAFSLVHESEQRPAPYEDYLNFVAMDNKSFCIWTDGINSLLNQEMISIEAKKDFEMLSKIQLKMMSLTGIP